MGPILHGSAFTSACRDALMLAAPTEKNTALSPSQATLSQARERPITRLPVKSREEAELKCNIGSARPRRHQEPTFQVRSGPPIRSSKDPKRRAAPAIRGAVKPQASKGYGIQTVRNAAVALISHLPDCELTHRCCDFPRRSGRKESWRKTGIIGNRNDLSLASTFTYRAGPWAASDPGLSPAPGEEETFCGPGDVRGNALRSKSGRRSGD